MADWEKRKLNPEVYQYIMQTGKEISEIENDPNTPPNIKNQIRLGKIVNSNVKTWQDPYARSPEQIDIIKRAEEMEKSGNPDEARKLLDRMRQMSPEGRASEDQYQEMMRQKEDEKRRMQKIINPDQVGMETENSNEPPAPGTPEYTEMLLKNAPSPEPELEQKPSEPEVYSSIENPEMEAKKRALSRYR